MLCQGYLDSPQVKTGMDPGHFRARAEAEGDTGDRVKAGEVVRWLSEAHGLDHKMAIHALLKGARRESDQ